MAFWILNDLGDGGSQEGRISLVIQSFSFQMFTAWCIIVTDIRPKYKVFDFFLIFFPLFTPAETCDFNYTDDMEMIGLCSLCKLIYCFLSLPLFKHFYRFAQRSRKQEEWTSSCFITSLVIIVYSLSVLTRCCFHQDT